MIRKVFTLVLLVASISASAQQFRTISGSGNNLDNPDLGAAGSNLERVTTVRYADGIQEIYLQDLPNPREVSNKLFNQREDLLEEQNLSDFVWLFGQFLDHDISLTENSLHEPPQLLDIPADDEFFNQNSRIFLSRNEHVPGTGEAVGNPREYSNLVTSFIDASQVYGSTQERADWLRTFEDGKLKTAQLTAGTPDLLPWNTLSGEFNDNVDFSPAATMADDTRSLSKYFVAGDVRANENPLLIAIHTLFVREHNRICDALLLEDPTMDDEALYQNARKLVGAYLQAITYYEWLPALGVYLTDYQGYNPEVNPAVMNVFSAAAFRFGHTMIDDDIIRMDNNGDTISAGNLKLREAFFRPYEIVNSDGLDVYFKGMGTQVMQEMDCKVISDLRNFLFEDSGQGLDLVSINIFRGRDRGLADYNTLRTDFGLTKLRSFEELTDNVEDLRLLEDLYGSVDNLDAWVGMLAEQHISDDAAFGELVMTIIKEQFKNLRDGDRFYFENDAAFTSEEIAEIKHTTMYDIMKRNTGITLMQENVFSAMPHMDIPNLVIEQIPLEAIAYPNPVVNSTTVQIYSEQQREMTYSLINNLGQLVSYGTMSLEEGQGNFLRLDLGNSERKGLYNLLLESGNRHKVLRLVRY